MRAFTSLPPEAQQAITAEVTAYPDFEPEQATIIALTVPAEDSNAA